MTFPTTPLVTTRPPQTPSALDAFADFLRLDLANGDASEDTIRNYRSTVGLWAAWCHDQGFDPATVTSTDVKRYRQALIEAGYSPGTIRWKLVVLGRFYEAARNANLRPDNPAAGVKPPRSRQAAEDFKYLSDSELARFLSVLPDPEKATGPEKVRQLRDLLMIDMMVLHALHTIEVQRANVEDLTEKGGNFALIVRGKTRDRLVYLRPDTGVRMKEHLRLRGEVARDRSGRPVFSTVEDPCHRLTRTRIRAIIVRYLRLVVNARIGKPRSMPQLTPTPLASTSPSSTARPGEKCWPASSRTPSANIERPATIPRRQSRNPITGNNDSAR